MIFDGYFNNNAYDHNLLKFTFSQPQLISIYITIVSIL